MARVKTSAPTRQEKAALTRRRMLDAAYDLFCELGYRATTMDAIAERAGVAVQTLYFTFHTKDELFQDVHERTVLGDEDLPPPLQPWYQASMQAEGIVDSVRHFVKGIGIISARVAPMIPAFHAVSGDPAGAVWQRAERLRHEGMVEVVGYMTKKAKLRKGMTRADAADVLYVLSGPELYRTLVLERHWTPRRWAEWTEATVLRDLFDVSP